MRSVFYNLTIIIIFAPSLAGAQVKAVFLEDSMKIGETIRYTLSFSHTPETEILMPDSSYNYYPFEFIRKEFFPTSTIKNISNDSAIYFLRTFETNRYQKFSLPIFILNNGDSTPAFPLQDTIYLRELVKFVPDSLLLRENAQFNHIEKEFNYPYNITIAIVILVTIIISLMTLGKPAKRRYKLFILRRIHQNFLKNYRHLEDEFTGSKNTTVIEQALSLWKTYISRLENKPVNTFTTTELITLYNKEDLKSGLQIIDKAIYGGLISGDTESALKSLRKFSEKRFRKKKKEIINA
ncbi:MAG TPA: hypothetical protein VNW99_08945 [Cytophagaceae bacterium]|nr:hypothetical protein [Cytophagaceae bacterium]